MTYALHRSGHWRVDTYMRMSNDFGFGSRRFKACEYCGDLLWDDSCECHGRFVPSSNIGCQLGFDPARPELGRPDDAFWAVPDAKARRATAMAGAIRRAAPETTQERGHAELHRIVREEYPPPPPHRTAEVVCAKAPEPESPADAARRSVLIRRIESILGSVVGPCRERDRGMYVLSTMRIDLLQEEAERILMKYMGRAAP